MKFCIKTKDDFIERATSPEKRRASIADLARRSKRLGWCAGFFLIIGVIQHWDHGRSGGTSVVLGAIFFAVAVQIRAEMRALQILELLERDRGL